MDSPMLKMSDDNNKRNAAEDAETRFVGIPTTPSPFLHPDHVAVGSPITRVPLAPSPAPPPPSPCRFWLDPAYPVWGHDFSRINFFDATQTDNMPFEPYASYFNETGTLPYVNNTQTNMGLDPYAFCFNETGTFPSLPYHQHVNNVPLFDKGYTLGTPDDHDNLVYHHLVDQRRRQLEGTSDNNYQILRDRYMAASQSLHDGGGVKSPIRFSQITPQHQYPPNANITPSHYYVAAKQKAELSPFLSPRRIGGDPATAFRYDNNDVFLQGRDAKHYFENGYGSYRRSPRDDDAAAIHDVGGSVVPKNFYSAAAPSGQRSGGGDFSSLPMLLDFYSVPDAQCYIYNLAKDQNGCRFLQRMVDEGTYQDICIVFEGIIGNVVELMIDSFGNYLVQKLLDVCTDDQLLQIVLLLTNHPTQLVRISLNTHGTRVVQKLIETLTSDEQVSLVKSAIQPGFLDLIKDLNGNHVIQRCLQCFSCQDNQFIFDAAVKFCVEIATHRHGCCVLQCCIHHSTGKNRDKLVTEICKHGLLLAQDAFGNYVVQYVIESDTPAVSVKLLSQFKGSFVILSTQKFSSHVVEKCLKHIGNSRPRIVGELTSVPRFEQLLQDPYANYVIRSALLFTKGPLHASLAEIVRAHKGLRTSPYCKRIFSGSLLKK
ncbi:hypothetical protein AAZX31_04G099700 [Glycine max]|uniref:mRNA-binding protein puf3 n=1 Tax=Glycine max TaxID=3847 RepID=UPI000233A231|nr:mRNA-binding protein puf3 [Glycine max]KAG5065871.1 hypothetical protein JHK86_009602 [Glycine max]KAH1110770.1 hypothetical protein GYH30_009535 [Glycine max]KRH62358.2 hypothetical protein GLYMA_04G102900v4 [Glycine max]|eukprot:XP_003523820.1 mRNA-binding protein puf3 [Glycine max]